MSDQLDRSLNSLSRSTPVLVNPGSCRRLDDLYSKGLPGILLFLGFSTSGSVARIELSPSFLSAGSSSNRQLGKRRLDSKFI